MKDSLILASEAIRQGNALKFCVSCGQSLREIKGPHPKYCKACRYPASVVLNKNCLTRAKLAFTNECACGCGAKIPSGNKWRRGHNSEGRFKIKNFYSLDFSIPTASYLLGVIHGDGSVIERLCKVTVGVGKQDKAYAEVLNGLFNSLGIRTKIYERRTYFEVACVSKLLTEQLLQYKRDSLWKLPPNLDLAEWVAGLIDTDGSVKKNAVEISQKDNGNLDLAETAVSQLGFVGHTFRKYKNHPVYKDFVYALLSISWLRDLRLVKDLIPLKHPRKIDWFSKRITGRFNRNVKGRGELEYEILNALKDGELDLEVLARRVGVCLSTLKWKANQLRKVGRLNSCRHYPDPKNGRHFVAVYKLKEAL